MESPDLITVVPRTGHPPYTVRPIAIYLDPVVFYGHCPDGVPCIHAYNHGAARLAIPLAQIDPQDLQNLMQWAVAQYTPSGNRDPRAPLGYAGNETGTICQNGKCTPPSAEANPVQQQEGGNPTGPAGVSSPGQRVAPPAPCQDA